MWKCWYVFNLYQNNLKNLIYSKHVKKCEKRVSTNKSCIVNMLFLCTYSLLITNNSWIWRKRSQKVREWCCVHTSSLSFTCHLTEKTTQRLVTGENRWTCSRWRGERQTAGCCDVVWAPRIRHRRASPAARQSHLHTHTQADMQQQQCFIWREKCQLSQMKDVTNKLKSFYLSYHIWRSI